jgi:hypothetical protein
VSVKRCTLGQYLLACAGMERALHLDLLAVQEVVEGDSIRPHSVTIGRRETPLRLNYCPWCSARLVRRRNG